MKLAYKLQRGVVESMIESFVAEMRGSWVAYPIVLNDHTSLCDRH